MGATWKMVTFTMAELFTVMLGKRKKCESKRRLDDQIVVITGANTGIGKETAYQLSLRGAKVIISCRSEEKARTAISDIRLKNPKADITFLILDLSSLTSVRQFAQNIKQRVTRIDILINNAGVMMCPEWKTEDGFEMQFGTNHLGHFLLTMHLLPLIKHSANARIINVSSSGHIIGQIHFDNINLDNGAYGETKAYAQSKLANVLFTRELAKRLGYKSNIRCYSLHPGPVATDLQRHAGSFGQKMAKRLLLPPEMGAQTTLYCALEESLDKESGFYYANCERIEDMISVATDDTIAQRLWELSCELVSLEDHLNIPAITASEAWQK